ncbi:MAG: hypothetical protein ACLFNZ_11325 [Spirochaetaceae bacterium]
MNKRVSGMAVVVVVLLVGFSGCDPFGWFTPDYVGTWESEDEDGSIEVEFEEESYVIKGYDSGGTLYGGEKGSLKADEDNNTMTLTASHKWDYDKEEWVESEDDSYTVSYKVSGDTLTLTFPDAEEPMEFKKQ